MGGKKGKNGGTNGETKGESPPGSPLMCQDKDLAYSLLSGKAEES